MHQRSNTYTHERSIGTEKHTQEAEQRIHRNGKTHTQEAEQHMHRNGITHTQERNNTYTRTLRPKSLSSRIVCVSFLKLPFPLIKTLVETLVETLVVSLILFLLIQLHCQIPSIRFLSNSTWDRHINGYLSFSDHISSPLASHR